MVWIKWMALGLGAVLVVLATLVACGKWRWAGATQALLEQLEAARDPAPRARYDERELAGLPAPVQRYFRTALTDGQPIVLAANVDHVGRFNLGQTAAQWKPFSSTQRVLTRRPGFVWDGRIEILPGLAVHVHDAYVAGTGILHPALLGLVTLVDLRGTGAVAQGELMRFLAETAWYPTALLPSQGVRWEAVDGHAARATLADGDLSLTLLFRFDAQGLIESVRAEARGRSVGQAIVMTPWEGRWSDYRSRDGMRVPFTGEVAWLLPEGRQPYWRGTIRSLVYEFGDQTPRALTLAPSTTAAGG